MTEGLYVCLVGGDQVNGWSQRLTIFRCALPLEHAAGLFELCNRMSGEYESVEAGDDDLSYAGLDGLAEEIAAAREKMKAQLRSGLDYSQYSEAGSFGEYVRELAGAFPERYGPLAGYISGGGQSIDEVFRALSAHTEEYFWLDQSRVSREQWESEPGAQPARWYQVMELFPAEARPFDPGDEDAVSIFGSGGFTAFADLSYGC